jgi:hypothetical protein
LSDESIGIAISWYTIRKEENGWDKKETKRRLIRWTREGEI